MRNNINRVFLLVLALLGALLALHFLPVIQVGGREWQRVDLLSELRTESDSVGGVATLDSVHSPAPSFVDSCKPGVVCIEDYGESDSRAMDSFYAALDKAAAGQGIVRIAFLGDSFIEGDILTSDLRDLLQARYGGQGTGFLNIRSVDENYRPTVKKRTSGFEEHSARDERYDFSRSGLSGYYCTGGTGSSVFVSGRNARANRDDLCRRSSIYFRSSGIVAFDVRVNGEAARTLTSDGQGMRELHVDGRIGTVEWKLRSAAPGTAYYGVAMDGGSGVSVDNCALRASTGYHIASFTDEMLRGFDRLRHYDLIVLQYGLNIAGKTQTDYSQYAKKFRKSLDVLRRNLPNTSILVMGVGDRGYKASGGELKSMPGVQALAAAQQRLAADCGLAFWSTFQAMGGAGSIVQWAKMKPARANLDFTHINFEGGKAVARKLFDALVWGKEEYDRRHGITPQSPAAEGPKASVGTQTKTGR